MSFFKLGPSLTTYSSNILTSLRKISRAFNLEANDFTNIVNVSESDQFSFITTDLGFITYFKVEGNAIPFSAESDENIKSLFRTIMSDFIRNGHRIIDTYSLYNDNIENEIKDMQASRGLTAHRLGMDISNKDQAMQSMLKDKGFFESRIVGIYTPDLRSLQQDGIQDAAEALPNIPLSEAAKQSLSQGSSDSLLQAHLSCVAAYESFLNHRNARYVAEKLECSKAIIELAKVTDPKNSGAFNNASASKFSMKITNAMNDLATDQYDALYGKDFSDILHPELPERYKSDIVKVGDRLYSFLVIESHPTEPAPFAVLQKEISRYGFPYRVKTVTGGNVIDQFIGAYVISKQIVSNDYFSFGAEGQNQYRNAYETLQYYDSGNCSTLTQSVFTTWVDGEENEHELRENLRHLKNALQKWTRSESIKVRLDSYTPIESYFSTLPSYHQSTAPKLPIPLIDSLTRMPFIRPTLPKGRGGELFVRYDDGKIDTLDTSVLAAQISFIVGASGRGKSVLNMKIRDSLIFARGNKNLPFEYNIEVGSSTKASTDAIKAQTKYKDQVEFFNIQNDNLASGLKINILSTPVGLREPLPNVFQAQLSLIQDRLVGMNGNELPRAEMMLSDALGKTYQKLKQRAHAKTIDVSSVKGLNTALRELQFYDYISSDIIRDENSFFDASETVFVGWDVVDFLISKNQIDLASKVQSLCEPLIADVIEVARSSDFQTKYNEQIGGSHIGRAFLSSLQGFMQKYPFVCQPSTTNIYSKHIVTFELGGVLRKGTANSDLYENRFWFGLASLFTRSVMFTSVDDHYDVLMALIDKDDKERGEYAHRTKDNKQSVAQLVRSYQEFRINLVASSPKKFHIDEMQAFIPSGFNNSDADYAGGIVTSLAFEARKFHVELACSSQRPEHGRYLNNSATMFIILGFPSDNDLDACIELFNIPEDEVLRYIKELQLDPEKGINAFVVLREVDGYSTTQFRQMLYVPIPGYEIWEYANSGKERYIRKSVQSTLTYSDALLLLTGALPMAGKSAEFSTIENELRDEGAFDDSDESESAKASLIAERLSQKLLRNAPMYIQFGKDRIAA